MRRLKHKWPPKPQNSMLCLRKLAPSANTARQGAFIYIVFSSMGRDVSDTPIGILALRLYWDDLLVGAYKQ